MSGTLRHETMSVEEEVEEERSFTLSYQPPATKKQKGCHVLEFMKNYDAKEECNEQALEEAFGQFQSLKELKTYLDTQKGMRICDIFFSLGIFMELKKGLEEQLEREPKSLKGEVLQLTRAFKIEQHQFVDIDTGDSLNLAREPPILVMGSSGSGKTAFSVGVLPKILQRHDQDLFFVYMSANMAFDDRKSSSATEAGKNMRKQIKNAIENHGGTDAMRLTMVVAVDEVGITKDRCYVGSSHNLCAIKAELEGLAKRVRLVLLGTGLDQVTTMVNSEQEATKIRLPPWNEDKVNKYIDLIHGEFGDQIKELIWSTPLYKSLSSNPRALSQLTTVLCEQLKIYDKDMINEDFVVATVTGKYIAANGLGTLKAGEKRLVAMIVWKVLADAEYGDTKAPNLRAPKESECHDGDKIEACCHSLLDVNLESKSGKVVLIEGQQYSVSITSAISLVLFALTGNMTCLCRNWNQFETVAALHELQLAYISAYPHCPPSTRVVASQTQFPGSNKTLMRVPVVNKEIILVNGALAEYADVISLDRLVQAKHAMDGHSCTLHLTKELKKLGVMKDCVKSKTGQTTALMRKQWTCATSGKMEGSATNPEQSRHMTIKPAIKRHGAAVSILCKYPNKTHVPFAEKSMSSEEVNDHTRPLSVVFVTNARQFNIPRLEWGAGYETYLQRNHVDTNGKLLVGYNEALQSYMDKFLLGGVSVKFFFLEQDEN